MTAAGNPISQPGEAVHVARAAVQQPYECVFTGVMGLSTHNAVAKTCINCILGVVFNCVLAEGRCCGEKVTRMQACSVSK